MKCCVSGGFLGTMRFSFRALAWVVVPSCLAMLGGLWLGSRQEGRELDQARKREADLRRQLARQAEFVRTRDPILVPSDPVPSEPVPVDPSVMDGLKANLEVALRENQRLSNSLSRAATDSDVARRESAKALAEAKEEILSRSKRIELLEGELGALNQQVRDLGERLARQNLKIQEAERMVASTTGDRAVMKQNLDAMLAERSELESRLRAKEALVADLRKARDEEVANREAMVRRGSMKKGVDARPASVLASGGRRPAVSSDVEVTVSESPRARANRLNSAKTPVRESGRSSQGK